MSMVVISDMEELQVIPNFEARVEKVEMLWNTCAALRCAAPRRPSLLPTVTMYTVNCYYISISSPGASLLVQHMFLFENFVFRLRPPVTQ